MDNLTYFDIFILFNINIFFQYDSISPLLFLVNLEKK